MYSRYPVNYINGFTVMNTETGESVTAQEIATVDFREMPPEFVEGQIEEHVVFKCAGGISTAMEDAYATVVRGSRESLAGLPVRFVMNLVRKVEG
jgi:predicted house-cleaning NTP pyrophosphatase (Maf/HAM1 superfamily)